MDEEIKISIKTEYDGSGAQQALKDEEKLQQTGSRERDRQYAVGKAQTAYQRMDWARRGGPPDLVNGQSGWAARIQQLGNLWQMLRALPMLAGAGGALPGAARFYASSASDNDYAAASAMSQARRRSSSSEPARGKQDESESPDAADASPREVKAGIPARPQDVHGQRGAQLARLVAARDGVADTAAVAREAMRLGSNAGVSEMTNRIVTTLQQHHSEAMGAVGRKNYSRP